MAEDVMKTALTGMAQIGNPRQPMDTSALAAVVNASADYTSHAKMHPRYSQPVEDPAFFPVARPQNVLAPGTGGASYRVVVGVPELPLAEAGPTTANGRVVSGRGTNSYGGPFWDQQGR